MLSIKQFIAKLQSYRLDFIKKRLKHTYPVIHDAEAILN